MKIRISHTKPTTKPMREYDTRFIYVGFKYRYNSHSKMLSSIERQSDGSLVYSEHSATSEVFSRGYHSENAKIVVYSESPKVWCEEISPGECFVFTELCDKVLG